MKTYLLAASVAALLFAGAAQAQDRPPAGGMRQPPDFDLDHDGKVTLSEFRKVEGQRIARMFARLDANHDGKITRAELQAGRERMMARHGGQAGGPTAGGPMAGGMMGGGDAFFRVNDLNSDGAVTKTEMEKALEQRFQAADTNHDGWLSKGELIMMRQRARGPGQ